MHTIPGLRRSALSTIVALLVGLCLIPSPARSGTISWRLYLKSSPSTPAQVDNSGSGTFVIDAGSAPGISSDARDLLDSLEGVEFTLDQSPTTDPLTINIFIRDAGDSFERVIGADVMVNFEVEAVVNGRVQGDGFFGTASLRMMISKRNGCLETLLNKCDAVQQDIVFCYVNGSTPVTDGVTYDSLVQGFIVQFENPGRIVGGKYADFGLPANVQYSTWITIKKLFE